MLDTQSAEVAVYDLLTDMYTRTDGNFHQAHRDFARDLVAAVANLIRSGTGTASTTVTTTGSATTQTGLVTITNVKIS